MTRYIDEKDVYKLVEPTGLARVHCAQIDELTRADVVPKSEIERLEHILNSYALQYGTVKDQHEVMDKAKSEVAREIFEEIDNILYRFAYPSLTAIGTINVINAEGYHLRTRDYAELKKKYTGEKECPNCRYFVGCECFDGKTCDEYEEKKE